MPIPPPPRPPVLGLLDRAVRIYGEVMVAAMRRRGIDHSFAHSRVMGAIPDGGIRLTDLADRLGITKQATGQLVDDLVATGDLERRPDPSDGRAKLIDFGPRSGDLSHAYEALQEVESAMAEHIGSDGVEQLRGLLLRLMR